MPSATVRPSVSDFESVRSCAEEAQVLIGFHPKAARFAQPLAQIAASFPVNMTFPFVVGFYAAHRISMNWGSILLIAMGTQWYILFNVIAGAMAIPSDLKEAACTYGLRGWPLWVTLILPAIFPFWVTGACTAAGGAWNASIVAEVARCGGTVVWWLDHREVVAFKRVLRCCLDLDRSVRRLAASKFG
ncbi:MAG TPA: ABC transporter permease subunit [Terrimicrobiaceae bacterium]